MAGGVTLPFVWLPVLALGSIPAVAEPGAKFCLNATFKASTGLTATDDGSTQLKAKSDDTDNLSAGWDDC